jgi:hypothetical protein
MAKFTPDGKMDEMLDVIEASHFTVCSAQPTTYAGIAAVALTSATAVGTITAAAGDVSGRKNTFAAVTGTSITGTGTATHVAFSNNSNTLYFVTTCTSQDLTSGGTVDTSAIDYEITDPA